VGKSKQELTGPLYEEIGRLKVEVDWLKKKRLFASSCG
jgi:hypothetical protein